MKTALSTCLGNVSFSQGISIDFFSNKLKILHQINLSTNIPSKIVQGLLIQLNNIENTKVGQLI